MDWRRNMPCEHTLNALHTMTQQTLNWRSTQQSPIKRSTVNVCCNMVCNGFSVNLCYLGKYIVKDNWKPSPCQCKYNYISGRTDITSISFLRNVVRNPGSLFSCTQRPGCVYRQPNRTLLSALCLARISCCEREAELPHSNVRAQLFTWQPPSAH